MTYIVMRQGGLCTVFLAAFLCGGCAVSPASPAPGSIAHDLQVLKAESEAKKAQEAEQAQAGQAKQPQPAARASAGQPAPKYEPGVPEFDDSTLQAWRDQFVQERKRFEAGPDAFFAAPASQVCPVSPTFKSSILSALQQKQQAKRKQGRTTQYFAFSVSILEGDCADGSLDGPGRYLVRYKSRTTSQDNSMPTEQQHEVLVAAQFKNDRPQNVSTRFERLVPTGGTGGSVSFAFMDSVAFAPKGTVRMLVFTIDLAGKTPLKTSLSVPQANGKRLVSGWYGKTKQGQWYVDANGQVIK